MIYDFRRFIWHFALCEILDFCMNAGFITGAMLKWLNYCWPSRRASVLHYFRACFPLLPENANRGRQALATFFGRPTKASRIRVVLIPSSTYYLCHFGCDLHKLAEVLNAAQVDYNFEVPTPKPRNRHPRNSRSGFRLIKRQQLSCATLREGGSKSESERKKAVDTYISVADAAEQALEYADHVVSQASDRPLSHDDIIIVIGGEVVIIDDQTNEFEGDVALDSYSCVAVNGTELKALDQKTAEGVDILDFNDQLISLQQVAFTSLRRVPLIFPELINTDILERARSIVARYIICNVVGFVGNRSFGAALCHDRITGCVNETNWIGGERDSYFVDDYCQDCLDAYKHYRVLEKFLPRTVDDVLGSLRAMLLVRDKMDKTVRDNEKVSLWINIGLVAVSLNILDAILVDVGLIGHDQAYHVGIIHEDFAIKWHLPALVIAMLVFMLGSFYLFAYYIRRSRLP